MPLEQTIIVDHVVDRVASHIAHEAVSASIFCHPNYIDLPSEEDDVINTKFMTVLNHQGEYAKMYALALTLPLCQRGEIMSFITNMIGKGKQIDDMNEWFDEIRAYAYDHQSEFQPVYDLFEKLYDEIKTKE